MFQPNIDTMREALFASHVQASDQPDSGQISTVIARMLQQFGPKHCAERVAEEFGDHPETAVARMRWIREAVRGTTSDAVEREGSAVSGRQLAGQHEVIDSPTGEPRST